MGGKPKAPNFMLPALTVYEKPKTKEEMKRMSEKPFIGKIIFRSEKNFFDWCENEGFELCDQNLDERITVVEVTCREKCSDASGGNGDLELLTYWFMEAYNPIFTSQAVIAEENFGAELYTPN